MTLGPAFEVLNEHNAVKRSSFTVGESPMFQRNQGRSEVLNAVMAMGAVLGVLATPAASADLNRDTTPAKVAVDLGSAYLPQGFDSNDNVQMVVEGVFENTCYRQAPTRAVVDPISREMKLYPQAYYYDGFCLQMIVPFHQTLDIGLVPAGQYAVMDMSGVTPRFSSAMESPAARGRSLGTMNVQQAVRAEADDYLYAPVEQAYVDTSTEGKQVLHLTGNFTLSCATMMDVKVSLQDKVLVVQPISQLKRETCEGGSYPFHEKVELPSGVQGRTLIHVRSLNGKALNVLSNLN